MKKIAESFFLFVKRLWLILGITLAFLILLEVFLSIVYKNEDGDVLVFNAESDAYMGSDWAAEYYKELLSSTYLEWAPYVHSQASRSSGKYINSNKDGIRKTWNDGKNISGIKIFMFGGSTLWGFGSRDNFTIPSLVSKGLVENGIYTDIVNYAVNGDVSTQSLIRFIFELRAGVIPDLVIFYGGVGDAMSACLQKKQGVPLNNWYLEKIFSAETGGRHVQHRIVSYLTGLSLVKFSRKIAGFFGVKFSFNKESPYSCPMGRWNQFSEEALDVYLRNVAFVKSIEKAFSFRSLFYLEPQLSDKLNRTEFEEKMLRNMELKYPGAGEFYSRARDVLNKKQSQVLGREVVADLRKVFEDIRDPIYVDGSHYGEAGNDRISKKIVEDILKIYGK